MKTKSMFRLLLALLLGLCLVQTGFGQAPAPKRMFSEVYYHKLKPGHTMAEARAIENEFKKLHQMQANDGFISGWYMLVLDMSSNPNKEYSYITIKNFSDMGLMDDAYPAKYLTGVMGTDYQAKVTDLMKRMGEVKETAKVEIWEHIDGSGLNPMPSPTKFPVWVMNGIKAKNNQFESYIAQIKKMKPVLQERVNQTNISGWSLAGLMYPSGSESPYDFAFVSYFPNFKELAEVAKEEAAFKKALPGTDIKKFYADLDQVRDRTRQEVYYLMEFAEKDASVQAKK